MILGYSLGHAADPEKLHRTSTTVSLVSRVGLLCNTPDVHTMIVVARPLLDSVSARKRDVAMARVAGGKRLVQSAGLCSLYFGLDIDHPTPRPSPIQIAPPPLPTIHISGNTPDAAFFL